MRIIFMGTPDFSVTLLKKLLTLAGHDIVAVYAQPPRPAGRGKKVMASPVQKCAKAAHLCIQTPISLRTADSQAHFADYKPDLAIVSAYGLLLPQQILDIPRYGCVNIHASLLPRWRGAAPIQRSIEAGDCETGVTLMQMAEGLDTGPILAMEKIAIADQETGQTLYERLSYLGAEMLPGLLAQIDQHALMPRDQPVEGVTYAQKLKKSESQIDWFQSAEVVHRKIRAFSPWPGSHTQFCGEIVKIKATQIASDETIPDIEAGQLFRYQDQLFIGCGEGKLEILALQRPGKSTVAADDFLRGYHGILPHKVG